jgi:hypothetical protein
MNNPDFAQRRFLATRAALLSAQSPNDSARVGFIGVTESIWVEVRAEGGTRRVTVYYFAYNFIKIHRTLRMTPAMAAGVTDRLWSLRISSLPAS